MADRDGGTGFAIGLVVGAVIGLAIGFLYAPRPGEETRAVLREKVDTAREKATEIAERVRGTATEAVKKAQSKLEEATEQTK